MDCLDYNLRFNIHKTCDFGLKEFSAIHLNIGEIGINNIDNLNNSLKENIKTHDVQVDDIEYINDKVIINCNINPISEEVSNYN